MDYKSLGLYDVLEEASMTRERTKENGSDF